MVAVVTYRTVARSHGLVRTFLSGLFSWPKVDENRRRNLKNVITYENAPILFPVYMGKPEGYCKEFPFSLFCNFRLFLFVLFFNSLTFVLFGSLLLSLALLRAASACVPPIAAVAIGSIQYRDGYVTRLWELSLNWT